MNYTYNYKSPLGNITLASDGINLTGLWFNGQKYDRETLDKETSLKDVPIFNETTKWLDIYFSGKQPEFTPPIAIQSTDFRKSIFEILLTIPYGHTMTYGEIAEIIAEKKGISRMSAQAVGGAVGHNPVSIIIPCHRVIGSNGSLTGYAGGIDKKIQLLKLENIDTSNLIFKENKC